MCDENRLYDIALAVGPGHTVSKFLRLRNLPYEQVVWPKQGEHWLWRKGQSRDQLLEKLKRWYSGLVPHGIRLLLYGDADFPSSLTMMTPCPTALFVQGELPPQKGLAIVGSRAAHRWAIEATETLVADFVEAGFAIISGGALGIDAAAHRAALKFGGKTVAVMGTGHLNLYPARNIELYNEIRQSGALISPFVCHEPPRRPHFPQRNQIIAALSEGIVVVEAQRRSGALNTAKWAKALGKPVFSDRRSPGGMQLLAKGAGLATTAEDVLGVLSGVRSIRRTQPDDPELLRVLTALQENALTIDALAERLQQPLSRLAMLLIRLELSGHVRPLAGGRYSVE